MFRHYLSLQAILLFAATLSADVIISEFMASNSTVLEDEDGDNSDWIEIENTGSSPVDITGWYLTDDDGFDPNNPDTYWQFPSRILAANERLIVFASGKEDRPAESNEFHTLFKLSASGEYLALIQADGTTIATEFSPEYPAQQTDISYGYGYASSLTNYLVSEGADLKVLVPADGTSGVSWTGGTEPFNDSPWTSANSGVGFDAGSGAAGFTLIDNFEELNPTTLDNQNDWSASANTVTVADDPENVENQVLEMEGSNVQAYKALDIPDGETGTLFFRIRRDGSINAGAGVADTSAPNNWNSYEATMNTQDDGIMKARDANAYDNVDAFEDDTWYSIWMVINNETDTYQAYMSGGSLTEQTLLDADSQTVFSFRNGTASNDLQTFYARCSSDSSGSMFIDDIYIAEGQNLGIPIGGTGYNSRISENGNIESVMLDTNSSVYLRIPFEVDEIATNTVLTLRMRYDDGFIAYLNGTEIARRNAPNSAIWNSTATAEHPSIDAVQFEDIDISVSKDQLMANGTNILAIHGLNTNSNDTDFLITPEIVSATLSTDLQKVYFLEATPSTANTTGYIGLIEDTEFSHDRGFYDAPFDVTITTTTADTTIIYTTDGSTPSESNGTQAASPAIVNIATTTPLRAMAVKEGFLPTNVDTQTYIFIADVVTQGNAPGGYPTEWLGSNGEGTLPADYEMDPEITEDPVYKDRLNAALLAIPTISIVTDKENFFDTSTGIYQRPQQSGSEWERPISFEIIQPDESLEDVQVDAGIRIQGGHTRNPSNNPKHSFRLLFKSIYGASKLEYDLFPDDPDAAQEFDQLILRGSGNQSWLHHNTFMGDNRGRAQYVRDQWAKDMQLEMGHPAVRNNAAHLYINGIYWGVYNPTERATSGFGESYIGGDKDDYVALNSGEEVSGEERALPEYQALIDLAETDLSNATAYNQMAELLDLEAFADYMILQQYGGNVDWPHHNWYAIRNTDGGKWYYITWDSEFIFIENDDDVINPAREGSPQTIWVNLMRNEDFKILFADRIQKYLFNEGLLTPDQVLLSWNKRSENIFEPLVAESARWGDYRRDVHPRGEPTPIPLYDPDNDWMVERNRLINTYFPVRTDIVIEQYRDAGFFPDFDAPVLASNGGTVEAGFTLAISAPDGGSIYYTTDGSDPRTAVTSAVSSSAVLYNGEIPIDSPTMIRARVLSGQTWSTISEATFAVELPAVFENLVASEIMYNLDGSDDAEYIELLNIGTETIDLSGIRFTEGIEFEFAEGSSLAPNAYILVVRDQAAFIEAYGTNHPIAGSFANDTSLDNGGETITLVTNDGTVIRSFTYSDSDPWPAEADGNGPSLQLVDPTSNPDHSIAASWQASSEIGGDPAKTFDGLPTDDEDNDGASALLEYAQGTSDQASNDRSESFYIFYDEVDYYLAYLVDPSAAATITVVKSTDLTTWESADSILELSTSVPTGNGSQTLDMYRITESNIGNLYFRLVVQ